MKLYTIGFTRKPAEVFFALLRDAGARRVIDVRLNPAGQLSGFAKAEDLAFFLRELCGMEYVAMPELAPTRGMLRAYRKEHRDWDAYARDYLALLEERRVVEALDRATLADGALLCSEDRPHRCHRRLAAEHLAQGWGGVDIVHLPQEPARAG